MDDRISKQTRARQQEHGAKAHVFLGFHLVENDGVQTDQSKVEKDGQQGVGVKVEVGEFRRAVTKMLQNLKPPDLHKECGGHVKIEEDIAAEGTSEDGAHNHGRFKGDPQEPNHKLRRTKHIPGFRALVQFTADCAAAVDLAICSRADYSMDPAPLTLYGGFGTGPVPFAR